MFLEASFANGPLGHGPPVRLAWKRYILTHVRQKRQNNIPESERCDIFLGKNSVELLRLVSMICHSF